MRTSLFFPAILALCIAQHARAQEKIAVAVPAIVEAAGVIGENVRRECAVEGKIGEEVFRRVSERFPGAAKTPSSGPFPSSDTVLRVTIIGAVGAGGGAWSGAKAVTIRADVMQDTKVLHSTVLTRHSSGGVFGGMTGTCPIMDRIAAALGRDVAGWLPPLTVPVKQE
jgi:hypothetical protein